MNRMLLAGCIVGSVALTAVTAAHASDADDRRILADDFVLVEGDGIGIEDGERVDYRMWFSDVYARTPKGWRYFFAQASLPLPSNSKH